MGDVAEMMLDGTLCMHCGGHMGEGEGFPRSCCEDNSRVDFVQGPTKAAPKTNCPICRKLVKEVGLDDHMRAKHGVSDIHVIVIANDKHYKLPSGRVVEDKDGPLVMEQYTRSANKEQIEARAADLSRMYGRCRVARLVFMNRDFVDGELDNF